jgi:hypothetical protein
MVRLGKAWLTLLMIGEVRLDFVDFLDRWTERKRETNIQTDLKTDRLTCIVTSSMFPRFVRFIVESWSNRRM